MEWSEQHDIMLARELSENEPSRFKARTAERGKVWQRIHVDVLNASQIHKFRITKRSVRDRVTLLLNKYKTKRQIAYRISQAMRYVN